MEVLRYIFPSRGRRIFRCCGAVHIRHRSALNFLVVICMNTQRSRCVLLTRTALSSLRPWLAAGCMTDMRGFATQPSLMGIIRSIHRRLELLVDRHPAGGYFELVFDGDFIVLHCRWPFNLVEDEWISIQNRYHVSSYRQAVDNAIANGIGKASGVDGGSLEIASQNDGFTIEFSRPQTGWSASSLQLHVRRPIVELLLQARLSRLCIFGPGTALRRPVASGWYFDGRPA